VLPRDADQAVDSAASRIMASRLLADRVHSGKLASAAAFQRLAAHGDDNCA
jgi:hypothetical protein